MKHLTIRAQLGALLAVMVLLVVGVGLFARQQLGEVNAISTELRIKKMASLSAIAALDSAAAAFRDKVTLHVLNQDPTQVGTLDREVQALEQALRARFEEYDRSVTSSAERAEADQAKQELEAAIGNTGMALALSRRNAARRNDNSGARDQLTSRGFPAFGALAERLARLGQLNRAEADRLGDVAAATHARSSALLLGSMGAAVLVAALAGFSVLRGIGHAIDAVRRPMEAMAKGELDVAMPDLPPRTEMGRFAATLRVFHRAMVDKGDRDKAQLAEAATAQARAERLSRETLRFQSEVDEALRSLASAATELDSTAASMGQTAQRGIARAGTLAHAAGEADANVQSVAASTEELSQSITEVSRQVGESAAVARRAAGDAQATNQVMEGLADSANRIGDVVRLINDIAGQTNLLALNATIEAARAGEAGKGFAVVAAEVKNLANQTAKATDEIGGQIGAMQSETTRAVESLRTIGVTIDELNRIAAAVAAATEQQSAATREISRAVQSTAQGTNEVTRASSEVEADSQGFGSAASQVGSAASQLSRQSEKLRSQVDGFLQAMRAA